MRTATALEVVRRILVELIPSVNEADRILPEHKLREDLELDSLDMVKLQVAVEDSLCMRFDPIEMDLLYVFDTVGSLSAFLEDYFKQHEVETPI